MTRARRRRVLCAATVLAALGGAALPALAAEVPAPAADADAGGALAVLLERAAYWRGKQNYDQALTSLDRALKLAPENPDALALLAQVQADKGDRRAAQAALDRLKKAAPDDPRLARLTQTVSLGPVSDEQLAEARRLAQAGKQAEAIEHYNRVFKGNPPPDALAVEYYQTLAGAEGGYDKAKAGLAGLVRQNPNDFHAQLAYAQVLTYRDAGRLEGIQRLAALSQDPSVAAQAQKSWRQAVGWLADTAESVPALQAYAAAHPDDADIARKLAQAQNPQPTQSPAERARADGFAALNKGRLADAEKLFQQAIAANADDADATGGLGLVRLRQHNPAEAGTLLTRAIALDPEHKSRWQAALTAANNPGGGPNPAVALINRGDFAAAEREVSRQAAQGGDVSGLQGMLADAEARQGRLDAAEATYRAALARAPNNGQLLVGLAGVLSREGKSQEADEVLARAQTAGGDARQVGQARAVQLRAQAAAATDPAARMGLYRAAVAADPESPWARLDLARALFKLGQADEARTVMAGAIGGHPTPDALKAGVIFANETGDTAAAAALLARLPPSLRTPDLRALQMQADLQRQIDNALQFSRPAARQRLLAMATAADPDGARGAALARALGGIGDKFAAREAVVAAAASTPRQNPGAKLRYAGALLAIGEAQAASDMLAEVAGMRGLSADDRQQLVQLRAGLAVRTADTLNEQGRQADAYDHLAPLLAQAPENPDLNLALARLYSGASNPREALQISETLLRRDPGNIDARKGAVEAALQLGDKRLADSLVQEGRQLTPDDPKTWMMSAELEKARGNNGRALRDLQRARDLRLQQLGYGGADAGADDAALPGVSLVPGEAVTYPPRPAYRMRAVPTADGGADQPQDLSVPPLMQQRAMRAEAPPFAPQPTTALGTAPSYRPGARALLDTSATDLAPPAQGMAGDFGADQPPPARVPWYQDQQAPGAPAPAPAYQPPPVAVFRRAAPPAADLAQGYYANPFRPGGGEALGDVPAAAGAAAPDAETEEIDRSIVALRDTVAPSVQGGFGFRERSGDSGLDRLSELTVPMEATFSPGGYGRLKLSVTPAMLSSGSVGGDITNQSRIGSSALGLRSNSSTGTAALVTPAEPDQHAEGLGLDLGYSTGSLSADIGSTPIGFREQRILGGVEWAPQISDHVRLRLTAERREVSDSILSYAGTVDPRTGETWGGVVRNHGRATLELSSGKADFYVLGGGATLTGTHVENNTEFEAGAGGSYPVYRTADQEVRVGIDLVYFGYSHNLRFFTLGQGGYFSPQSFLAALVPVTYKETVNEDLSYEIGGSVGYSSFRESSSPYYPLDSNLQAQLVAQQGNAATAVPGVQTAYPARTQAGFAGTAHASLDYRVSPSLHLGGRVEFQHSTNFDETMGMVYAKYLFNGAEP